jgi:hypothetical protein
MISFKELISTWILSVALSEPLPTSEGRGDDAMAVIYVKGKSWSWS